MLSARVNAVPTTRAAEGAALCTDPGTSPALDVVALYDAHLDFVWRSLRRLGVDSSDLEDATQDVFLVVHRRRADFEWRGRIRTWIFGIALRVAKAYRRRSARCKSELTGDGASFACGRTGPEQAVANRQTATQVQEALDGLTEDQRAVLILADLEHMAGSEIATALSIPTNTVYSRLRNARAAFEEGLNRILRRDDWRMR